MAKKCSRFLIHVNSSDSAIYLCYFDDRSELDRVEPLLTEDWRVVSPEVLLGNLDDFLFRYPGYSLITRIHNNCW